MDIIALIKELRQWHNDIAGKLLSSEALIPLIIAISLSILAIMLIKHPSPKDNIEMRDSYMSQKYNAIWDKENKQYIVRGVLILNSEK